MNYDEQTAAELIQKFNLDPTTQRVWKTRGKIPVKYMKDGYEKPVEASKADQVIQKRIIDVLQSGYLQISVICELSGVSDQKYQDVKRGNVSTFSAQETLALKKEITKIRLIIAKTFEKKSSIALRALLDNPAILVNPIVRDGGGDKNDYDRLSRFKRRIIEMDGINYELVKDCFIKAALKLSI
jgi:hypothetical protein